MSLAQTFETKHALGGEATIVLTMDKQRDAAPIFTELWRQIFTFERQFSRFLPESELSQLNRQAGITRPITVEFSKLLQRAAELSKRTNGLYNPFILPALQRAGYKQSALPGYEHDDVADYSGRSVVGIEQLVLHNATATIPYGTALDMGGCGKGYLADQLADFLDTKGLAGYWISLSGDIVVQGVDEHSQPWEAKIQSGNPSQAVVDRTIFTDTQRVGIATSGTFRRSNQPHLAKHHLIDPTTGEPAETDIQLATVVARSAVEADVLASCAVIVGSKSAMNFLKKQGVLAAFLQTDDKHLEFGQLLKKTTTQGVFHA